MTAALLAFPARMAVTAAWDRYAEIRKRELDDPRLMIDRAHMEEVARAHRDWQALFLEQDARA